MKPLLNTLAIAALLSPCLAQSAPEQTPISKKRLSVYQTDLICPAARHIGCGSAAKPLLLELERDAHVDEAWLNRAGTVVAVVWKEPRTTKKRTEIIQSVFKEQNVRELKGEAREQALKGFLSGNGWYRGAAVDRLSEEEAVIMAARLVRKMRALISVPEEKASALQQAFTAVLARKLTNGATQDPSETHAEILKICRQHFDEKEIAVLQQAYDKGTFSHLRDD